MKVHISRKYEEQRGFIENVPALFASNGGKLILKSRNIVRLFPEHGFVAKEFHRINFVNKFVYACIRKSKAQRSFEYAQRLLNNGFGSPEPVAWIDIKRCLFGIPFLPVILKSSFYICRECKWQSLQQICGKEPAEDTDFIVNAYVADVLRMHNCGIVPVDTNPGNVFYEVSGAKVTFQYIDLNRMHLYNAPAPMSVRFRSIARMSNNEAMFEKIARIYFTLYYAQDISGNGECMNAAGAGQVDAHAAERIKAAVGRCRQERRKFFSRMELKDKIRRKGKLSK